MEKIAIPGQPPLSTNSRKSRACKCFAGCERSERTAYRHTAVRLHIPYVAHPEHVRMGLVNVYIELSMIEQKACGTGNQT